MNKAGPVIAVLVIMLAGCSIVTRNAASDNFKSTVQENTKHISIERDFSVVLSMDIIHINRPVRKAYVDEYARLYMLSKKDEETMLRQQLEQDKQWQAFYLIVYTAPDADTPLDSTDSLWKLYVSEDSRLEAPVSIEEITSQRDFIKGFFPWISSWDRVYLVRFKKAPGSAGTNFKFIITGILGKGETDF